MSQLPKSMEAFVLHQHGGPEALRYHTDWPVPEPAAEEVLIKVGACGMNNTDINTRVGWYSKAVTSATADNSDTPADETDPSWGGAPISFPRIQGADAVGVVVAVGKDADPSLMGKRIMVDTWLRDWSDPLNKDATGYYGSECNGGFSGYTTAPYQNVAPINSDLTDAELATFSCSYTTAEGMLARVDAGPGDRVLVTGASGGVGSALVQLARRRGATVIAQSSPAKWEAVQALGADAVIDRSPDDLAAALTQATGQAQVDVVCDVVGGPLWPQLLDVLVRGGRYACSGAIAGPIVPLDLRTFYLNDLTLHGSTVVPPDIFRNVLKYIEAGEIKPLLAATYSLRDLPAAQMAFGEKGYIGNIVVIPDAS